MDSWQYLFPSELRISETTIKKVLIIGQCNSLEFQEHWKRIMPETYVNYIHLEIASELPEVDFIDSYQLVYIQIPLRSIIGDEIITIRPSDFLDYKRIREESKGRLELILKCAMKYNIESSILTVVSNFIVPQSINSVSLKDQGTVGDFKWLVSELNIDLANYVQLFKNTYIGDTESIASSVGKRYFYDDFFSFSSHGTSVAEMCENENFPSWALPEKGRIETVPSIVDLYGLNPDDFRIAVFKQIEWIYRVVNQIDTVKLVVFDLDNTLWRGQIAQNYDNGKEWPDFHLWVVGIWEAIQILRRRGIPVSIISKNDEDIVKNRWNRVVPLNWIKFEDFIAPKINWNSKSENMLEIIDELSITPKGILFIDDNPYERAEVQSKFPEIRVAGGNPYELRRILLWSSETNRFMRNEESINRELTYRAISSRKTLQKQMSREEFLKDLEIKVKISRVTGVDNNDFSRIIELINKTNQFNTTGIKWTFEAMVNFFNQGGEIFTLNVSDRLSKYGIVGALLFCDGIIRQYVLSCRVLGLGIDTASLLFISNILLEKNEQIYGVIIPSELNGPCINIFKESGYDMTDRAEIFNLRTAINKPVYAAIELIGS